MNITLLRFLLGLLFLAVPAYCFWRLDRRLARQSLHVLLRAAVSLGLLSLCLYYVFRWNLAWVNLLWILLSFGVATAVYCRKRWLFIPVYVGAVLATQSVGLLVCWLLQPDSSPLSAWVFIPVMAVLQADALFVCRRGLTTYVQNSRQHGSLGEYLQGNGASRLASLLPFVAVAMKRAFTPVMSMLLLVGVVFVPSLLVGLLVAGIPPLQAVAFLSVLTCGALCSTVLALLLTILVYTKLKQ